MNNTKSEGVASETYTPKWSVIGNKVYLDGYLFCKTTTWPYAMLIKRSLECHDDLLSACERLIRAFESDYEQCPGMDIKTCFETNSQAILAAHQAIDRATPQKEGAK